MDDEGEIVVEGISHYNAMEEGAQRYWRASRIWRDKEESNWTFGAMIQELRDIQCYRGTVAPLATYLLDQVVRDERPSYQSANDERMA